MNKNYFAPGSNYYDHHKEMTVNVSGNTNVNELVRTFFSEVEDITPEPVHEVKKKSSLPFLVLDKLSELGTYTLEEFDAEYHKAVKGGAPKLAKFLKHYNELQVFDFEDRNKKQIFEELKAYFGAELGFGYPNFAAYY